MDNKINVSVFAPILEKNYDVMIPIDKNIAEVLLLLLKGIPELSKGYYQNAKPLLYNQRSGKPYNLKVIVKNTDIHSGTKLILL